MKAIQVFVVSDKREIFEMVESILESGAPDMEVCGFTTGLSAVEMLWNRKVDVVLIDKFLKYVDGAQVIREIKKKYPTIRIVVLAEPVENLYDAVLYSFGAVGYVTFKDAPMTLVEAIRRAKSGERRCSPQLTAPDLEILARRISNLSGRTLEVFNLIGKGLEKGKIAKTVGIQKRTVDVYMDHLQTKFGVNERELVCIASEHVRKKSP